MARTPDNLSYVPRLSADSFVTGCERFLGYRLLRQRRFGSAKAPSSAQPNSVRGLACGCLARLKLTDIRCFPIEKGHGSTYRQVGQLNPARHLLCKLQPGLALTFLMICCPPCNCGHCWAVWGSARDG